MTKLKIKDNSGSLDNDQIVSPTQIQMDNWVAEELAEAEQDNMLGNETPQIIFSEADESID